MTVLTDADKARLLNGVMLEALTPDRIGKVILYIHNSTDLSILDIFDGDATFLGELIVSEGKSELEEFMRPVLAEALSRTLNAKVTIEW